MADTGVAVEGRLEDATTVVPPASPGWTAALLLTAAGLDGAVTEARAAVAAGAGAVRLAVAAGAWATADLERLTATLQRLGAALGDALRCEPPTLDLVVEPNGDVRASGERLGHLADLHGADRYLRAAPARARSQAARVLESFLAWHAARRVVRATG
ncbi:MAG: hypothetical protein CVU56_25015 [Deltaproteobacteria bacterium HGW-Deltaproteobacteria-14]|nr:MAG: hypothetical protein CVU56_25015 [Deltaproteobacteria bacterium HGW-Deltaproteobacteria-14]